MRAPRAIAAAALALALVSACGGQVDRTGLDAWLRIPSAQFVVGPLPAPSGGPSVQAASVTRQDISAGLNDRSLAASVDLSCTGVALGLEGDRGYWILPSGPPDVQQPGALTLDTALVFSPLLPSGDFVLDVIAIDAAGRAGAPFSIPLHTEDAALPDAGLAFTLSWDTESDLDLHVVDPFGVEVYWGNINSWTGPPSEYLDGGILDFDSNANCIIDGRRRERVVWAISAPSGHYVARVDTPSLCGQPDAHWQMTAQRGSSIVASAFGEAVPADTRGDHGLGAGITALELDVP